MGSDLRKIKGPSGLGGTTAGPFYKKRGYASSQLEMRRESNSKTANPTTGGVVNN